MLSTSSEVMNISRLAVGAQGLPCLKCYIPEKDHVCKRQLLGLCRGAERKVERAPRANRTLPLNKALGFLRMSDLAKDIYMLSASSWQSVSGPQSRINTFVLMICIVTPGGGSQEQLLQLQVNCSQPEFAEQTKGGRM